MNLETKIIIYKFTPQVFTLTRNFFQSIGKAKISIFLSLTRQLLYLLPGLLIFPHYFGLDGIWICMPVSDFFAFVTAAVALWIYVKRLPTGITEKAR